MKKCNKCNFEYTNEINFCKKCGSKLEHFESELEKEEKEKIKMKKQKIWKIVRYIFGITILLGSVMNFIELKLYGLLGVVFGLSVLPIVHDKVFSIKKVNQNNFVKKYKKALQITTPVTLGLLFVIFLPGEQLETITINDNGHIIAISENYEIDFYTNLSETNKEDFEYFSSNPQIATVDKGIIVGKAEGNVTITIKGSNSIEKTAEYQIKYIDIDKIKIDGNTKVAVGKSSKLIVDTKPKVVSDKIIRWESSNSKIISVDNEGNIVANNKGSATIIATTEKGKKATINIDTYIEIEKMSILEKSTRVEKGKSTTLNLNLSPKNADINGITWSSDNTNIAKVKNGKVTGIAEGSTTITATSINGVKAKTTIEVYEIKPKSVSLNKKSVSLSVGKTASLKAIVKPSNATDKSVIWSSSNSSVASVKNGVITAKNIGTATITAKTLNGKTATVEVKVTKKAPIKINNFKYTKDYVCGIEWNFSITNNSDKTINYVTLKWYNFNAVGDFVYDKIDRKNYVQVRYTGPLRAGANSGSRRNSTKFYNCNYNSSAFSDVKIEYADGTIETISRSDMIYYTNLY